jgi:glycosyltransferase involved in cell wall biosynthesis
MLEFLFFGRLDREKWRDAIIAMLQHFSIVTSNPQSGVRNIGDTKMPNNSYTSSHSVPWSDGELPFVLHIFGKGSYEKKILQLAEKYPQHIIYYWFETLEFIKKIAQQCDYALMPSLFLETFGLSAVNALARWLPVIAYQQWGMAPFVLNTYNLWSDTGSPTVHLIAMMEKLLAQWSHNDSKKCREIAGKYSKKERIHKINKLIYPTWTATHAVLRGRLSSEISDSSQWQKKKFLLVTDFVTKIGGIETYVHDVAALLTEQWHTVEIIWSSWWKIKISRIFSMLLSICNMGFAGKLQKKIDIFAPDIIRCHSVLRHIGRLWLRVINTSKAHKWMMYHDLWYIAPFPHSIYSEKHIPVSLSWSDFSANIRNPMKKLLVFGKRCLIKLLWKQLKQFNTHLVPSDFMMDYIAKETDSSISRLPHFIQE